MRLTEPGVADKRLAALKAKVDEHHLIPDTQDVLSLTTSRPMFVAREKGMALAKLAQSIYGELHEGDLSAEKSRDMPGGAMGFSGRNLMLIPGTTGGTDAGFAASSGTPAVLEGFGLAGWGCHAKDEYIDVDSIVPRLHLTSRMLMELGSLADSGTLPRRAK